VLLKFWFLRGHNGRGKVGIVEIGSGFHIPHAIYCVASNQIQCLVAFGTYISNNL
jgi:hypothetical protein